MVVMYGSELGEKIKKFVAAKRPNYDIICTVASERNKDMPAVMEAIDRMSPDERIKTMEYLWAAMTAAAEPESPAWHGDVLAERRRRVAAGEEGFMSVAESKRRLYEEVHAR